MKKQLYTAGALAGGAIAVWQLWRSLQTEALRNQIPAGKKILIAGAGFGGMAVARRLGNLLRPEQIPQITVVDQHPYLLFTPMLSEVAGGELEARHIVASPEKLAPCVQFQQGTITAIDVAKKRVTIRTDLGDERTLEADHLVIALGSVPNYHGIQGLEQHSLSTKSIRDAIEVRDHVLRCLRLAAEQADPSVRRQLLTFVTGGGGYTGVEMMAAVNDFARESARDLGIDEREIQAILIETGNRLMPELSENLAGYARQKLKLHGIQILLNKKVTEVKAESVTLDDGDVIPTRTVIWAGGVKPHPLIESLDCERGHHGGIVVDEYLRIRGCSSVWALGDCAEVPRPGKGSYAPTAQNANQEGEVTGRNIAGALAGRALQPFRYKPVGELALVGRHSGVGRVYGVPVSGVLAWAMWRAVYLTKMPGAGLRSRVALDWTLDAIFGRSQADLSAIQSPG